MIQHEATVCQDGVASGSSFFLSLLAFTKALTKLEALAKELKDNAGTDTWMTDWFDSMFGKWKSIILPVVSMIIVSMVVFALLGCCIILCVRSLIVRDIDRSVTHQMALTDKQPLIKDSQDLFPTPCGFLRNMKMTTLICIISMIPVCKIFTRLL